MGLREREFAVSRPVLSRNGLGRAIADARTAAGLSQATLGRLTGLGQTAISKIETGQRKLDAVELVEIATELSIEVAELLSAAREMPLDDDGEIDMPPAPSDTVARLLGRHGDVAAGALAWVPPFLARLDELERLRLDG